MITEKTKEIIMNVLIQLGQRMKRFVITLLYLTVLSIGLAHSAWAADPQASAATQATAEGVIRRLDIANRRLTIKHGPIANLNMSGMTMSFKATAEVSLDDLKEGDAIFFSAVEENGQYLVTQLRKKP